MTFHVGQKVVCVYGEIIPHPDDPRGPIKGQVYTISWIGDVHGRSGEYAHLDLVEMPFDEPGWVRGYDIRAFRPIVERSTDISIFTEMLDTTKQKVPA